MLIGARLHDRMAAALAATLGISLTGVLSSLATVHGPYLPYIIAPIGASAVLVFAVPASPLAQPWAVFGGNAISALVALVVSRFIDDPLLATGVAVGAAIAVMSLTRCLHPPGGAVALMTALAAHNTTGVSFDYALTPVSLNSGILVACGWLYHKLYSGHAWPHRAAPAPLHGTKDPAPAFRYPLLDEDIDAAVADLRDAFDISRDDLVRLLRQVELRAFARAHGPLQCADIMSKDVVSAEPSETLRVAAERARARGLRVLPVVNKARLIVGSLETSELSQATEHPDALVASVMREPVTAAPDSPAFALLGALSDGRAHGVLVANADRQLLGLITQTDVLAAVAHSALFGESAHRKTAP